MNFAELLVLAIGLSMDAFAISICKGLSVEKLEKKHMVITGLWFGGSQMAMPIIGYFVGGSFYEAIQSVVQKFEDKHTWMLPVVDKQNRYMGFISKSRILNAYREQLVKIQQ